MEPPGLNPAAQPPAAAPAPDAPPSRKRKAPKPDDENLDDLLAEFDLAPLDAFLEVPALGEEAVEALQRATAAAARWGEAERRILGWVLRAAVEVARYFGER